MFYRLAPLKELADRKRGFSTVIATSALILLTIASAVIIIRFVIPYVRNTLNEGSECFNYRDYFSFEEEFGLNCVVTNPAGGFYDPNFFINIRAKTTRQEVEEKVAGLKLLFKKDDVSQIVDIVEGEQVNIRARMYLISENFFLIPKSGESRTYVYSASGMDEIYDEVEVYPLLKSGKLCEKTDSIRIALCQTIP